MIGYAVCASFCTHAASLSALERLVKLGYDIQPIISENAYTTDTRFGRAEELARRMEELCGREIIHTVSAAEPLGPKKPLDALVIAPCTGNTLAKIANGITDTAVTMAAKAHLRRDKTLLIALATNDAMSQNLGNIAKLITRRSVYFVRMKQDDPEAKPHSLVAEMSEIPEALEAAIERRQMRPLFLS
ncbi:MAG: dipicolinate synthase subunit B [Clostridia bacterium]|nr:dipicolinate synthase subunit B [Clostridia bacterium]